MPPVRVRIAPSPTGPTHVGTAYQALFDLAFARRHTGQFILRIEDTDKVRSRRTYENQLIEALRWLGLDWDEGPDIGGPHGPYRQSERLDIYQQYTQHLLEAGHAYYCFCSPQRLVQVRTQQNRDKKPLGYDGHCRDLGRDQVRNSLDAGTPHVVRMKVPTSGTAQVSDLLRQDIKFNYDGIADQIVLKSDGFPTYHLAVVIDDHLMGITHVLRGEEWISSTPKHLLLYKYFGWQAPVHVHLPLLLNPDRSKMSKRRNPTSVEYYRRAGYLPQALLNYLALMAYPPLVQQDEKFSMADLTANFELERINLGSSVFDIEKLDWLNGRYIRENLTPEELLQSMRQWLLNDDYLAGILPLLQPRVETLGDVVPKMAFLLSRRVEVHVNDLVLGKHQADEILHMLQTALWAFELVLPWEKAGIEKAVHRIATHWDWPIREVTVPLIVAVTGRRVGPPLFESLVLLGIDLTRQRLMDCMEILGGLSKKKAAKLEKSWLAGS